MGRVGQEVKKNNLRSKDDVWTVVLSESPWTANRRSQQNVLAVGLLKHAMWQCIDEAVRENNVLAAPS